MKSLIVAGSAVTFAVCVGVGLGAAPSLRLSGC